MFLVYKNWWGTCFKVCRYNKLSHTAYVEKKCIQFLLHYSVFVKCKHKFCKLLDWDYYRHALIGFLHFNEVPIPLKRYLKLNCLLTSHLIFVSLEIFPDVKDLPQNVRHKMSIKIKHFIRQNHFMQKCFQSWIMQILSICKSYQ